MYQASEAFHNAAAAGEKQTALLVFPDMLFTDEDIDVEHGISFRDNFNMEENLSIGQAPSNELSFTLFNDDRTLNDYPFGDFTALLGARIGAEDYAPGETARIVAGSNTYTAHSTAPYLRKNGTGVASQPDGPVVSLLAVDDTLYAFTAETGKAYYLSTGGSKSGTVQAHMVRKAAARWQGRGEYYDSTERLLTVWQDGIKETYEMVPLGCFTAKRPKAPDTIQIDLECYDYMQKFEEDYVPGSLHFPTTIGEMYAALCRMAGVTYESSTFINSTATVDSEPEKFDGATWRDILKWIAEAAGSNAVFNRDGKLEMRWIRSTAQRYEATNYGEFNPVWYETKPVSKLYNRDTMSGTDLTLGSGAEGYLIQDNPLLEGVT